MSTACTPYSIDLWINKLDPKPDLNGTLILKSENDEIFMTV